MDGGKNGGLRCWAVYNGERREWRVVGTSIETIFFEAIYHCKMGGGGDLWHRLHLVK